MLFPLSSVRATLNSAIAWAVKQSFSHFPLIASLPKMHCSFCPLPDVIEANSGVYQSIFCISFVTSQFDSILLNNMGHGIKGKAIVGIHNFCTNLSFLMSYILEDMFRGQESCLLSPSSKQKSELGKSQTPAMPCQAANGLQGTGMTPCSQLTVLWGLSPGECAQHARAVQPFMLGWGLLPSSEQAGDTS